MTACLFTTDGPPWTCTQCGWVYARKGVPVMSERPPRRNCPKAPDLKPAAEKLGISWDDVAHYAAALARWTAAGFPTRTQKEVQACLRVCITCDDFVPNDPECTETECKIAAGGRCRVCKCPVTVSRVAIINLAKMATGHCQASKWPGDPPLTSPATSPTPPPQ